MSVIDLEMAKALAVCTGAVGVTVTRQRRLESGELVMEGATASDFERFAPSEDQVRFATWYCQEYKLERVFVGVNFPGKRYGVWMFGQVANAIMDPDPQMNQFMVWEDRSTVLDELKPGDAAFVVYADGLVGSAIEYI